LKQYHEEQARFVQDGEGDELDVKEKDRRRRIRGWNTFYFIF
jgi:hypothetical protein